MARKSLAIFTFVLTGATVGVTILLRWKLYHWWFRFVQSRSSLKFVENVTNAVIKPVIKTPERITLFFASQTGTAESFSRKLHSLISSMTVIPVEVADVEDLDPASLRDIALDNSCLVVFCVATHGEGEPTDSARTLFKWVQSKKRAPNCLAGLHYAVMSLGNSQYVRFNEAGRRLDKHLKRLGGIPICQRGEGDDDSDIELDFSNWTNHHFFPALGLSTNVEQSLVDEALTSWKKLGIAALVNTVSLEEISAPVAKGVHPTDTIGKFYFNCFSVPIREAYELRQKPDLVEGKMTKHIEVDLSRAKRFCEAENELGNPHKASYVTGDNLEVLPRQPDCLVEWMFKRLTYGSTSPILDITLNTVLLFNCDDSPYHIKCPFPSGCSLKHILQFFCDLSGCPTRDVLRNLACFIKTNEERENVASLLSDSDTESFNLLIRKPMLNLKEAIDLLMPSAVFCDSKHDFIAAILLLPRLAPRPYTISSSSLESPNLATIAVSLVAEKNLPDINSIKRALEEGRYLPNHDNCHDPPIPRYFSGVCSSYLCSLSVQDKLSDNEVSKNITDADRRLLVRVVSSSFKFPVTCAPLVMIAAGTGIAPFRAFLKEIEHRLINSKVLSKCDEAFRLPTSVALFFGCRKPDADFIYRNEIFSFLERTDSRPAIISHFFGAFSREQEKVIYVQDHIQEQAVLLHGLIIAQGGVVYICGSTRMGSAVKVALCSILGQNGYNSLIEQHRLVEELWS